MESAQDTVDTNLEKVKLIRHIAARDGKLESPIDLNITNMMTIELNPMLWSNYDVPPKKLKLTNTGHTVIMSAKWQQERPYLNNGPFLGNYVFSQIHFHWGATDMDGSEHHIDSGSLPMELHAVHFKSEYFSQEAALKEIDGIVVLVYMFKLQSASNPSIDTIVKALPFIQQAHTSTRLTPQPITSILRPFTKDYFLYWGSISTTNSSHYVLWIVSREPIGVSTEQIAEFRTINNVNGEPLLRNCRQLQDDQDRNVFHVSPSGHRYASLLPIPRDSSYLLASQRIAAVENRRKQN